MADKKPYVNYAGKIKEIALTDTIPIANGGTGSTTGILHKSINDFRLTITSNTPVTTSDVTGATAIYLTPYKGNSIGLYDGTNWNLRTSAQITITLGTLTSGKPYDVFCYDNSGTPTIELLVWTNDTTRATALVYQDGILCKSGALTRRYIGSFYTTSTTTTEDSAANRYLFNYYNRVEKPLRRIESTDNWTQSSTTLRQANNNSANQVSVFKGVDEDIVKCDISILAAMSSSANWNYAQVVIGLDSTSTATTKSTSTLTQTYTGVVSAPHAHFADYVGQGKHDLTWLEAGHDGYTITWYSSGSSISHCSGLFGLTKC